MGCCSSSPGFVMPGVPGAEILDDDEFMETLMTLELKYKTFDSTALYTRGERQRQEYSADEDSWKQIKYFEKQDETSAGLIFKMNCGEWLMLELTSAGFWWSHRLPTDSKRIAGLQKLTTSETWRKPVPIHFVRKLLNDQRERCYERGSLFNFSEFATTIYRKILEKDEAEVAAEIKKQGIELALLTAEQKAALLHKHHRDLTRFSSDPREE
ncbi:unnamed protein product [Amoebophrya sp. A120]|nr:unnamed protein product [Amoebophrya sp. A120]|eukprot:GSA120T00002321001.1